MEIFLVAASLAGLFLWSLWYVANWPYNLRVLRPGKLPWLLLTVPLVSAAIVLLCVWLYAASDVVSDWFYILTYFGLGVCWLRAAEFSFRYVGINAELDVLDRGNGAALAAYAGGLIGVALCYAGGNIGEGPGAHAVVFCAGLATIAFGLVWLVFTTVTEVDHTVTVDRDLAAGLRLGSFLIAAGVILGRSVTGDWISVGVTLAVFFRYSWPVVPLLLLAILIEYATRPTVERPTPAVLPFGFVPAAFFLGCAGLYLLATTFSL